MTRAFRLLPILLLLAASVSAEVVRIEIRRRDNVGGFERLIGRIYFAIDPRDPANRAIVDLPLAPADQAGLVQFSSDVMVIRPRGSRPSLGTVFLEIVNRGREQSLGLMSGAASGDAAPEHWDLGDRFVLEQGFTLAFIGWQFDVRPGQGLGLQAPAAAVRGTVRGDFVEDGRNVDRPVAFALPYCASPPARSEASMTFRDRFDAAPQVLPRASWRLADDGCSTAVAGGHPVGIYEAVYEASGSPIAGLGFAAVRDFVSYLKHGADNATLRERPAALQRVLGFGYSQSARFLRDFVRDGFNRDEHGRAAFDALMISSAGAGGGSFNHRFAMPGQAGNSVLSVLRPVDVPPFTDAGLLARATADGTAPRIFYTFSSTEYWARAGSLTHTSETGDVDVALAETSRLYFLAGTAHAGGPLPPTRAGLYQHDVNFAEQRWTLRALLLDLDAWIRSGAAPPPSRYPTIDRGELVTREAVRFPVIPSLPFPSYMPQVWRMDFAREPPLLGEPYALLVPQVDGDGNDLGGIRLPEVAVPLGTYSGWNPPERPLAALHYLGGLVGSFEPFARTARERQRLGDPRPAIAERYKNRSDYLTRVTAVVLDLIRERFILAKDRPAILERAKAMWAAIMEGAGA